MTLMWEVRAADGRIDELLAHVLAHVAPEAQVYRSADGPPRVVVLDPTGRGPTEVPPQLMARAPGAWLFRPVGNAAAGARVNRRVGIDGGDARAAAAPPDAPAGAVRVDGQP